MEQLNKRNIPVILILNKADIRKDIASTRDCIEKECGQNPLIISAKEQTGIEKILQAILESYRQISGNRPLPEIWLKKEI